MNANQKIVDLSIDHLTDLTRIETSAKGKVLGILSDLESEIVAKIHKINVGGVSSTLYQKKRLVKLLATVQKSIKDEYSLINKIMREQQKSIAQSEFIHTQNTINNAIGINITEISIEPSTLNALAKNSLIQGAPSAEWWGRQSQSLQRKFTDEARRGFLLGETNTQIVQRIMGTKARGYSDGVMSVARHNAAALVNTSIHSVANESRMKSFEDQEDIAKGYRHISTMDNKTSPICQARSDLVWTLKGKPVGHHIPFERPPNHWNCRSTIILVLKDWDEISGKKKTILKDELTPSQRAVMGGNAKVANYEDWLAKQHKSRQLEVLGQKKYDIWKTGKLSFRDMVDQRGNPLTVDELAKKVGAQSIVN